MYFSQHSFRENLKIPFRFFRFRTPAICIPITYLKMMKLRFPASQWLVIFHKICSLFCNFFSLRLNMQCTIRNTTNSESRTLFTTILAVLFYHISSERQSASRILPKSGQFRPRMSYQDITYISCIQNHHFNFLLRISRFVNQCTSIIKYSETTKQTSSI